MDPSKNRWAAGIVMVLVVLALMFSMARADGAVIETADRTVDRVEVTYAEPVPTDRFPNRHYFETNDGAAYRYGTYGICTRAGDVPNRVCRTVFWYAR